MIEGMRLCDLVIDKNVKDAEVLQKFLSRVNLHIEGPEFIDIQIVRDSKNNPKAIEIYPIFRHQATQEIIVTNPTAIDKYHKRNENYPIYFGRSGYSLDIVTFGANGAGEYPEYERMLIYKFPRDSLEEVKIEKQNLKSRKLFKAESLA